eukprot:TRINITY_DN9199_c0_g5_i1.p1 TRINITY_DN9199_c0_g5~~TRINITY_DN9199_c0_g5_i1.p1  ORF type:complete len:196 (+),score=18.85 TRINITY_DN9199_c0_g5_i1:86-673(+)
MKMVSIILVLLALSFDKHIEALKPKVADRSENLASLIPNLAPGSLPLLAELPAGSFSCMNIDLLNDFNLTHGRFQMGSSQGYWGDLVSYICESTPHTEGDTVSILHYRREHPGFSVKANIGKNEVRDCQRFDFSVGTPPPKAESNLFNSCKEGQNCNACVRPENVIGSLHIKRDCMGGTCTCHYVKDCCWVWPEC